MIHFVDFKPEHAIGLRVQPGQEAEGHDALSWSVEDWRAYACGAIEALSAILDGECIGVCFLRRLWAGRGEFQLLLGHRVGAIEMLAIHRKAKELLDVVAAKHGLRRIETVVRTSFEQGHRWAEMLGFDSEGLLRRYAPDGSDYTMYSRLT